MTVSTDTRRKLVEGTEVLRTGGAGAKLDAGECGDLLAELDRVATLVAALRSVAARADNALRAVDRS